MNYLWLIVVLVGLYAVGTGIYQLTQHQSIFGYITNSIYVLVGLMVAYWAYGKMTYVEPVVPSILGGKRRYRR